MLSGDHYIRFSCQRSVQKNSLLATLYDHAIGVTNLVLDRGLLLLRLIVLLLGRHDGGSSFSKTLLSIERCKSDKIRIDSAPV